MQAELLLDPLSLAFQEAEDHLTVEAVQVTVLALNLELLATI